jgi:hypothetical protein
MTERAAVLALLDELSAVASSPGWTSARTSPPRASSSAVRRLPTNPAAPVTRNMRANHGRRQFHAASI